MGCYTLSLRITKKNVLWVGYLNTTTGSYQETLNFKESVVAQRERERERTCNEGGAGGLSSNITKFCA